MANANQYVGVRPSRQLLLRRLKAPTVGALISYMTAMDGGNAIGL